MWKERGLFTNSLLLVYIDYPLCFIHTKKELQIRAKML